MTNEVSINNLENEIAAATPLMKKIAKQYLRSGLLEHEDALQIAHLGFIRAAQNFKPEKGASLRTYAQFWIHHELQTACNQALLLAVPLGLNKEILAEQHYEAANTPIKSRKYTHTNKLKAAALPVIKKQLQVISLSAATENEDVLSTNTKLANKVEEEITLSRQPETLAAETRLDFAKIRAALQQIPPQQQQYIMLYFFHEYTFQQIATETQVSREAVRQTINRGLKAVYKLLNAA